LKKTTHSTVRLAGVEDTSELVELTNAINEESNYGLAYNKENAFKYIYNSIWYEGSDIIVAEKDDEILGYVTVGTSLEYHDKPFCYVGKFFVFLSGRRTDASRKLITHALKWAKEQDCTHVFVTATAGLDKKEQQLFINLMKKSGLVECGPVLSLKME
jgi:GNAT superfamily N-acetyltransferase